MWFLALLACARPAVGTLPEHHLVFAGTWSAGRELNAALDTDDDVASLLGGVPLLAEGDLSLIAVEGVFSDGGALATRGDAAPRPLRARPRAVEALRAAGVDVVNLANNHAGDYGPAALAETVTRLRAAGLDAVGAGLDAAEAREPVYRRVEDVVVAFVGVDLTGARAWAADEGRPGIFTRSLSRPAGQDEVISRMMAAGARARRHAHLVVASPHWSASTPEAVATVRAVARRLVESGYDAVLGHSGHTIAGLERVHGRPVIYDAGNLGRVDAQDDPTPRGFAYDLRFTRAGVTGITVHPLRVGPAGATPAEGTVASRLLAPWDEATRGWGTSATSDGATRVVEADPGWIEGPWSAPEPPTRAAAPVVPAPDPRWPAALPPEATPADVVWPAGVRLVGYHLLVPELGAARAAQVVTLYLRAEAALPRDLVITLRATDGTDAVVEHHRPGDWSVPGDTWPVGALLMDRTLFAFTLDGRRGVRFEAALGAPPLQSTLPVVDGRVILGAAGWNPRAPRVGALLDPPGK